MQTLSSIDIEYIESIELFSELKQDDFTELYKIIQILELNSGVHLISQGEQAENMYVVLEGMIEVYMFRPSGERLVLAALAPGDIVGEDALDSTSHQTRSANAIAITKVRVAQIPKFFLRDHTVIDEKLSARRLMHDYDRMLKLVNNLHFIKLTPEEVPYIHKETYQTDEIIFSQGDDGNAVYFIINGLVRIIKKKGEKESIIAKLSDGQCFGELAILEEQKRSATAMAEQETHLLKIDKMLFLKWHNAHPIFRDMLHSLRQVYHLKDDSLISVYTGIFKEKDCISTIRTTKDGKHFISTKIINEETVLFYKLVQEENDTIKRFVYTSTKDGVKRELQLLGNKLIGVIAQGPWPRLGEIINDIVKEKHITLATAELFQHHGEINLEYELANDNLIVCKCMRVSYKDVSHFINLYGNNVERIVKLTGASLVCGVCKNKLDEFIKNNKK